MTSSVRNSLFCVIFIFLANLAFAQREATTFVFVRHAEKERDGTGNPALTQKGKERAARLATMLEKLGVDRVYSTNYERTKSTAKPLADKLGKEILIYDVKEQEALLDKLVKDPEADTYLMVGHSNTVPFLVNHLLNENRLGQMGDDEYNKLFIVVVDKQGKAKLLELVMPAW